MTNLMYNEDKLRKTPSSSRPSQVAVIRREFVDLTGDHFSAVILNQLLYWTQRVKDFDLLLEEERIFNPECNVSPRHGWIYKSASELSEETMLRVSHTTMRKYLKGLIDRGWIDERPNSIDKWKKTTQYRVNLRKIQEDLHNIGHTLPDVYRDAFSSSLEERIHIHEPSKTLFLNEKNLDVNFLPSSAGNLHLNTKNYDSNVKISPSNERNLHSYTYTENTGKNKNKEHTQRTCAREALDKNFFDKILGTWKKHIGQDVHLTEERQCKLTFLLSSHFGNNLSQWEQFCERISASPFLMGGGLKRWKVSLDWILSEDNVLKVLEGNFDDPESFELKKSEAINKNQNEERSDILASIADPIWQDWCTQLSLLDEREGLLSLYELKEIASARFAEFDGRLIWIESEDRQALNRIDDLRLKILTVAQKTYPKARNIRTQFSTFKAEEDFLGSNACPSSEHSLAFLPKTKPNKKQPIGEELYAE